MNIQESAEQTISFVASDDSFVSTSRNLPTLACLPIGAHLILRCRADWREATVIQITPERVTLSVGAPRGTTYRVRRPPDSLLFFDGSIPVLGEGGGWRAALVRYDLRW